jgi:hypothetical protein
VHTTPVVSIKDVEAPTTNGHARSASDARRVREAEEFELEGLMSEEDELDSPRMPTKRSERLE